MARNSPLMPLHERAEATFIPWGEGESAAIVVERYAEIELEYAAIRRGAAILDRPDRGTVLAQGADHHNMLNNMLTQQLNTLADLQSAHSFWLNRKGRIDADIRLTRESSARTSFDLDVLTAAPTAAALAEFVFAEDASFTDESESLHRFDLIGPRALDLLAAAANNPALTSLADNHAAHITIDSAELLVTRQDDCATPGLHLLAPADHAAEICETILRTDAQAGHPFNLRPIGWHAYNIARLEAGTPLFHIDFGPNSLPAETALQDDRVSFTKGCYLGQEVVARMQSLGHPKQTLVALRAIDDNAATDREWQPDAGSPIRPAEDAPNPDTVIGAVTSSARSPMLGDAIIALAMVKWNHHTPNTNLRIATPKGDLLTAVQPQRAFWQPAD